MLAYEADTAWNRGFPCNLSRHESNCICYVSFFILWLTVSKRVLKIIIWRLNEKSANLWGSYSLNQGNLLYFFQNTNLILFVLFISLFFDLLYQRRYQRQYFWTLNFKSFGLWVSYGPKQGNTLFCFKQ